MVRVRSLRRQEGDGFQREETGVRHEEEHFQDLPLGLSKKEDRMGVGAGIILEDRLAG